MKFFNILRIAAHVNQIVLKRFFIRGYGIRFLFVIKLNRKDTKKALTTMYLFVPKPFPHSLFLSAHTPGSGSCRCAPPIDRLSDGSKRMVGSLALFERKPACNREKNNKNSIQRNVLEDT